MTIQELFDYTWDKFWNKPRFNESGWAVEVWKLYRSHIRPHFGDHNASKLTRREIRKWHSSLHEKTPTTANRALEVLSRMYRYGMEYDRVGVNPCALMRLPPERKRQRYASEEELKRLFVELRNYESRFPREVSFIRILAATGIRPRALQRAKLSELSRVNKQGVLRYLGKSSAATGEYEVTIIDHKILTEVVDKLPIRSDGLLIGTVNYKPVWAEIRAKAGCPDLWARDLRRTFASIALSSGVKLDTIAELLNHRSTQTTKTYAKLFSTARAEATDLVASKMSSIM